MAKYTMELREIISTFGEDEVKNNIGFKVWLFGHYHADRLERPGVEMFHLDTEELEEDECGFTRHRIL